MLFFVLTIFCYRFLNLIAFWSEKVVFLGPILKFVEIYFIINTSSVFINALCPLQLLGEGSTGFMIISLLIVLFNSSVPLLIACLIIWLFNYWEKCMKIFSYDDRYITFSFLHFCRNLFYWFLKICYWVHKKLELLCPLGRLPFVIIIGALYT